MRILIIEDERKLARALKRAFEQERYAVDISFDSDDGLMMAETQPYDAIIVDRMLPGSFNGIEIVKKLRKKNNTVPILLLTALGQTTDKTTGLDAGADDYLVKPFAIEELLARIRSLLRRTSSSASTSLSVGEITLDPTRLTVSHGDTPVTLTAKEFALLEYFLRNPNRILSKGSIMSHVWDYDADILPNTVEAYVKQLRNKLDKPFGTKYIETIRGFGYKLIAEKAKSDAQ